MPQEITDDVLSVLFQQCVPSFRSIPDICADRSLDQIPRIALCPNCTVPNSQCLRSTGQNGSDLVRNTSTGCSGQGKFRWVCSEEGLGHGRLIYLISITFLASNHSVILHSENMMAGVPYEGVYARFRRVVEWGDAVLTGPCLQQGSHHSAHREEQVLSCQRDQTGQS